MTIRIKTPEDGTTNGTTVFNSDGVEIKGVTSIDIAVRLNSLVAATLEIEMIQSVDMENIHALLGTETLECIAKLHGYKLRKLKKTKARK